VLGATLSPAATPQSFGCSLTLGVGSRRLRDSDMCRTMRNGVTLNLGRTTCTSLAKEDDDARIHLAQKQVRLSTATFAYVRPIGMRGDQSSGSRGKGDSDGRASSK
jgi:hypothetical protein